MGPSKKSILTESRPLGGPGEQVGSEKTLAGVIAWRLPSQLPSNEWLNL